LHLSTITLYVVIIDKIPVIPAGTLDNEVQTSSISFMGELLELSDTDMDTGNGKIDLKFTNDVSLNLST